MLFNAECECAILRETKLLPFRLPLCELEGPTIKSVFDYFAFNLGAAITGHNGNFAIVFCNLYWTIFTVNLTTLKDFNIE